MSLPSAGSSWHLPALIGALPDTVWAALVSATVTLALALLALPRRSPQSAEAAAGAEDPATCEFLLNGSMLRPLSGGARALLDGLAGSQPPLRALTSHLEQDSPRIGDDLEGLLLYGASFRRTCLRPDGSSYEVEGQPRGGAAVLSIRPASAEARALDDAERALERARSEANFLRRTLDRAPILAWTLGPDNHVRWANAAYRSRFEILDDDLALNAQSCAFTHLLEEVPLTARSGAETRRRVRVGALQDGASWWFEVTQTPLESGETLGFAVEVDDLVAAEASLRRFVETLTETFAHLPIGLAVFDKNRRLGLFNPALSDLVKIDAVWLAGRPSLRDFLERLRETRQMPEQKDFTAFRRMLTTLEEGARDGTYEENWVLPSGKIFRVSGRPHPQGALAFLFEDISPAIHLERRYRAELELSQATLDRMSEAVAVFDTSGMLVFVNSAFEELWELDPMASLDGPTVAELAAIWDARCRPTALWSDLQAFATGADARTSWTGGATMLGGRSLSVLVAPLPNGSTLVTFRDREAEPTPAVPADYDALAALEGPAQVALAAIGPAMAAAPDARAFAGLSEAAHALRDGLARAKAARERQAARQVGPHELPAPRDPGVEQVDGTGGWAGLSETLRALLGDNGIAVDCATSGEAWCPAASDAADAAAQDRDARALRALLPPLATAIEAVADRGAAIVLSLDATDGLGGLVVRIDGGASLPLDPEPQPLAAAREEVAALGGRLELRRDGRFLTMQCTIASAVKVGSAPEPAAVPASG